MGLANAETSDYERVVTMCSGELSPLDAFIGGAVSSGAQPMFRKANHWESKDSFMKPP